MMTDPVADMLTRIRNANMVGKPYVEMVTSKEKVGLARVLRDEGFTGQYEVLGEGCKAVLRIALKYGPLGEKTINKIERVSKPGRRVYNGVKDLIRVRYGLGIAVVSTSKGILSDRECRAQRAGGEVLCEVY